MRLRRGEDVDVEGGCLIGVGERNDSSEYQCFVGVDFFCFVFCDV